MAREVPHARKRIPLSDLNKILKSGRYPRRNQHYANFDEDRLRGLGVAGVKVCPSPLTLIVALTTLSHYRASVIFAARRSYASAVLGVVILCVRLSVRLSHACFVTNPKNLPVIF